MGYRTGLLALVAGLAGPARAGAGCGAGHGPPCADAGSEARACLQTKVWEHYDDGWSLRTIATGSRAGVASITSRSLPSSPRWIRIFSILQVPVET